MIFFGLNKLHKKLGIMPHKHSEADEFDTKHFEDYVVQAPRTFEANEFETSTFICCEVLHNEP